MLTQQFTEKAENKESNREEEIRLKELKKDEAAKIKEETALIKAETAKLRAETARQKAEEAAKRKYQSTANRLGKVLIDSMTRSVGREITRGIFGSLKKCLNNNKTFTLKSLRVEGAIF
nr:DUF853 domain-containing protein [Treponema pedis]